MPSDVRIRARGEADLPALGALLAEVHRSDSYPADPRRACAAWLVEGERPGDPAWVAESDGRLLGHVALERDAGVVRRLFVAPTARGLGVATALMDAIEGGARRLDVVDLDRAAIALYEGRGWVRTGSYVGDWTAGDGKPARVLTYELGRRGRGRG